MLWFLLEVGVLWWHASLLVHLVGHRLHIYILIEILLDHFEVLVEHGSCSHLIGRVVAVVLANLLRNRMCSHWLESRLRMIQLYIVHNLIRLDGLRHLLVRIFLLCSINNH